MPMIDFMSSLAFSASCSAPAGTPVKGWRCGGGDPFAYSSLAWLVLFALSQLGSASNAPSSPIHGALGASATSSVVVVRQ